VKQPRQQVSVDRQPKADIERIVVIDLLEDHGVLCDSNNNRRWSEPLSPQLARQCRFIAQCRFNDDRIEAVNARHRTRGQWVFCDMHLMLVSLERGAYSSDVDPSLEHEDCQ
jgi:hypothetical protein